MKSAVVQLSVFMLILSAVRLGILDRKEIREYQVRRNLDALVPMSGSLAGIDAKGNEVTPSFGRFGFSRNKSYLLVFVIHANNAVQDVQFWNRVIDFASESPTLGGFTEYWGICDYGHGCDSFQPTAKFRIIGFLDLHEMRAAAEADTRHEAFLYDHLKRLSARVQVMNNPSAVSDSIIRETR